MKAIRVLISAMKSVEVQKEHENFLRKQFQLADSGGRGLLIFEEFVELLRHLSIQQFTKEEIKEIFDEINTDQVSKYSTF